MANPGDQRGRSTHSDLAPDPRHDGSDDGSPLGRHRNTSLLEWMWQIEIERRDAVVTVQTEDDREGSLWCVRGNIVDAQLGRVAGNEAARQILGLQTADFSVAFGIVDRPHTVTAATEQLLLGVASRPQSVSPPPVAPIPPHEFRASRSQSIAPVPAGTPRQSISPAALPARTPTLPMLSVPPQALQPPPATPRDSQSISDSLAAPRDSRPLVETESVTYRPHAATFRPVVENHGVQQVLAVAALAAAGILTWHWLAPSPHSETAAASRLEPAPTPVDLRLRPSAPTDLFVDVEVDPERASIWLDNERMGTGRLRRRILHDGRIHEVRFEAPGYVTQTLEFREEAPSRLVRLETAHNDAVNNAPPTPDPSPPPVERRARPVVAQRTAVGPMPVAAPPQAADAPKSAPSVAADSKDVGSPRHADTMPPKPKFQIVGENDALRPRVHVLSDRDISKPKIQIVDGAEGLKPKVQVIDTDSPKVQVVE
jgi:hypothetical protein